MNNYADIVKDDLENVIAEIEKDAHLYLKNPATDFSRKRKLSLNDVIRFLLVSGGKSLKLELLEYFSYDVHLPTSSAFIQQKAKILPEAFQEILKRFTKRSLRPKEYKGYKLLAVDGSDLAIAHNPNDEKTYFPNGKAKGFNSMHLNAIYDLCNKVYTDISIQQGREKNERQSLIEMIQDSDNIENSIIIADRGYESYNVMEHLNQIGSKYIIRIKDVKSNGISSALNIPNSGKFDKEINLLLTRRNTNEIKANPNKYKYMPKNQKFDFLQPGSKNRYPMNFRIVRFPIGENRYEVLVTNLSENEFSKEELKEMYHMRWGIETSFRELKYAIGLTSFHSKKVEYIKQEIFAKLTMYNFCEIITLNVVLKDKKRKHVYQVNFTTAISICLRFFKAKLEIPTIDVETLIEKFILPVRENRKDPRKIKSKSFINFLYRVA